MAVSWPIHQYDLGTAALQLVRIPKKKSVKGCSDKEEHSGNYLEEHVQQARQLQDIGAYGNTARCRQLACRQFFMQHTNHRSYQLP